jgi:protein SCO1
VAALASVLSESDFAALVDAAAADPARRVELGHLLREDHYLYQQRSTAAVVRMRGWVLLALARVGVADAELLYILEELDTGTDAYLVAAAARALRSYTTPSPEFAGFVMRAINNVRYRDDPVCFSRYGEYATSGQSTSPVRELLAALAWLGPHAGELLPEIRSLRAVQGGLPKKLHADLDRAIQAISAGDQQQPSSDSCCTLPPGLKNIFSFAGRRETKSLEEIVFQDQDGKSFTFGEMFRGRPSIVVFFYTRCDNPLKCSLTITRLARVQNLLESRGLTGKIGTAAITYDPGFDLPDRLRSYGQARGLKFDADHRMLRTAEGFAALRNHFELGVNFVASLVNRHKIEAYVLDANGRIASCFERIQWDEQELVERAIELLNEANKPVALPANSNVETQRKPGPQIFGVLAAIALAFFPKCPLCWASYLSLFGIAGLEKIPYSPWLQSLFAVIMLFNLATVWFRRHSRPGMVSFWLVAAGTLTILIFQLVIGWQTAAILGVGLTMAGSLLSAFATQKPRLTGLRLSRTE